MLSKIKKLFTPKPELPLDLDEAQAMIITMGYELAERVDFDTKALLALENQINALEAKHTDLVKRINDTDAMIAKLK